MTPADKRAALAQRIRTRDLIIVPGVYDMISVRIADRQAHPALYMTGYGTVASYLGLPDAGLASYSDMVHRAGQMAAGSNTPIIADADTGYGGLLNVQHTIRGFEAAGIAAIQIEDQEFPKKCGHTLGRRVIEADEMVEKIRVACDAREDPNFLIIARTDSRTTLGLKEAIERASKYSNAGADALFIEAPESEDEFAEIGATIDAPLIANMVEGGRSPLLNRNRLSELGFAVAIYPATGFTAAAAALEQAYRCVRETGSSDTLEVPLYPVNEMHDLMGFGSVWDFEKKWSK
ncbi:MAG TPA: carboxyvinyl-carboxyphosphonate phosphorylmutase [Gammaproteobacteria bacterium]|nr:carboxyvinyl-carboxyphosphonate phosphorylmutase [Gammaproteobacteria bacterium]